MTPCTNSISLPSLLANPSKSLQTVSAVASRSLGTVCSPSPDLLSRKHLAPLTASLLLKNPSSGCNDSSLSSGFLAVVLEDILKSQFQPSTGSDVISAHRLGASHSSCLSPWPPFKKKASWYLIYLTHLLSKFGVQVWGHAKWTDGPGTFCEQCPVGTADPEDCMVGRKRGVLTTNRNISCPKSLAFSRKNWTEAYGIKDLGIRKVTFSTALLLHLAGGSWVSLAIQLNCWIAELLNPSLSLSPSTYKMENKNSYLEKDK